MSLINEDFKNYPTLSQIMTDVYWFFVDKEYKRISPLFTCKDYLQELIANKYFPFVSEKGEALEFVNQYNLSKDSFINRTYDDIWECKIGMKSRMYPNVHITDEQKSKILQLISMFTSDFKIEDDLELEIKEEFVLFRLPSSILNKPALISFFMMSIRNIIHLSFNTKTVYEVTNFLDFLNENKNIVVTNDSMVINRLKKYYGEEALRNVINLEWNQVPRIKEYSILANYYHDIHNGTGITSLLNQYKAKKLEHA